MNFAALAEGAAGAAAVPGFLKGFMGAVAVDRKSPAEAGEAEGGGEAGFWERGFSLIVFLAASAVLGVAAAAGILFNAPVSVFRMFRGSLIVSVFPLFSLILLSFRQ